MSGTTTPKKIAIIGCGNWATVVAKIIGSNTQVHLNVFDPNVKMWVLEEIVDGRKLSEIINTEHENLKYLPGMKIPANVVAETDLVEMCRDADILVFVIPSVFVTKVATMLKGNIKPSAIGISLVKGLTEVPAKGVKLATDEIKEVLDIEMSVLMGASTASEVAEDKFCEATLGSRNHGRLFQKLFNTENLSIRVVDDCEAVELCGALRNIIACAAGFAEGQALGDNTKAAIVRLGFMEMVSFVRHFYPETKISTFFESCSLADVITTWYFGGRNHRICEAFVHANKTLKQLEDEMLNGQSAQGPVTAAQVYKILHKYNIAERYPLFCAVHLICTQQVPPTELISLIRHHPEHACMTK